MSKIIYCAGEEGKVVLDILRSSSNNYNIVFGDDDESIHGKKINGTKILGGIRKILDSDLTSPQFIVAFGDKPGVRLSIAERISEAGYTFFNAVHSSTVISDTASVGEGVMINGQSYIGPGVEIHNHVLIDSCVNISHDTLLRRGATVTPDVTAAGGVIIGPDAYIGPGATIVEDITIGEGAIVGAGSVVMDDVPPGTTVVGTPAEPTG